MEYVNLALGIIACVLCVIILILVLKNRNKGDISLGEDDLKKIREAVNESVNGLSSPISNLIAEKNKSMMDEICHKLEELNKKTDQLTTSYQAQIQRDGILKDDLKDLISAGSEKQAKQINDFITKYNNDSVKEKEELMNKLKEEMNSFNNAVKEKLEDFKKDTKEAIKELSETVSKNLSEIRTDNNEKLEKINQSVNEKLQKTLEEKLQESFKGVVEGIGQVNTAVGEIKGLATDVGSLKNVLTNVKAKGIMGEVILGNIIREFLVAGQYEENIATKKGSSERVEFAVRLPGDGDNPVWLPIDSKFPYESYSVISSSSDMEEIREAKKLLRSNLLKYAKDVHDKYIDVPNTTDFAVIFLPLEGLYLEALNMGLFEEIQREFKVNLTGPTTLTAFINSLNMGFRSLMIQKKSSEVFKTLGAVKTEFNKFTEALEKTQNRVNQAADELDKLVGTRTRKMNSALKGIEALPEEEASLLMNSDTEEE